MYRVFLVDDESLILEDIINTVPWMDNGFEVAGSDTDPEKAVSRIMEIRPDAVFCDLKMPVMDGNELIRRLKEEGVDAEFVMISAYDSFANVREFFQQEGYDYILKPVNRDDMQMVLEGLNERISRKRTISDRDRVPGEAYADPEGIREVIPGRMVRSGEAVPGNPEFNRLIMYVNEHFMDTITLDLLSEKFGFARNYICGLFQKYYNRSLTMYQTELRMKHARMLLVEERRQIKEAAASCGYSDYHHFFKVFKKYYGMSPKEMQEANI